MTTSEPTTGEIAVFIPMKKSNAIGIFSSINLGRWTQKEKDNAIKTILCAPVPKEISKERMSDVIKFLADRLESLEQKLELLNGGDFDVIDIPAALAYLESVEEILPHASALIDLIQSLKGTAIELIARAEQAESREKAAVNNAVRAVFYDTSNGKRGLLVDAGICDYCQSDKGERVKCKSCFENRNFELRNDLRGLPQEGEGK